MKNEFVTYEQALALKELGFSSPYPIGGYQGGAVFYYEKGNLYYDGRPMYSSDAHAGQIDAPLYQQAFRWFREKYGLFIQPNRTIDTSGVWYYFSIATKRTDVCEGSFSYESAEQACLDKLIEIAKKQII